MNARPTTDGAQIPTGRAAKGSPPMTTTSDVRLFAYRQGPWRGRLDVQGRVDDTVPTTATVPPAAARGAVGRPLPVGTHRLLAAAPYPRTPLPRPAVPVSAVPPSAVPSAGAVRAEDRLGHLLVAALGLQRREPSNRFNDHRSIASVRSKFPVHAFTVAPDGSVAYLDLYRHALVELRPGAAAGPDTDVLRPGPGDVTVLLAARFSDLPTPYARLRCALSLLELGINLRGLHTAADLFGVGARLRLDGADASAAARVVAGSGPGTWSAPLVVTLEGVGPLPATVTLPGTASSGPLSYAAGDARLREEAAEPSVVEAAAITEPLTALACAAAEPVRGVPDLTDLPDRAPGSARPDWAQALWNRTAGRVPATLSGFSARPATLGEDCLTDLLAWGSAPAPGLLAGIARRVRVDVALQRMAGLPTGSYTVADGQLVSDRADPDLMRELQDGFSYPLTPVQDCGLRHANAMWVFSADIDGILDDFGPAGWSLLQIWCGWGAHGVSTAAAAHGLFARPARSFEEFRMQQVMGLPRELVPVFTVTCGRSRFAEPMLDMRI